ncbi:MAG: hypothetical protein PUF08_07080 [Clostridiales bacterium]|nr:hypothetical protein [Clostridiales bacterium]
MSDLVNTFHKFEEKFDKSVLQLSMHHPYLCFISMFICLVIVLGVLAVCEQGATPQLAQNGMVDVSSVSQAGDSIDLGSSKIEFYGPITESESDRNNDSIVMKIIYGDTSFLFTGDAEHEEEQEILNAGYDLSATVLKVGHHGSKNSTTYPFLREIMPQYTVISVGDNSYGHLTEDAFNIQFSS